ncbi:MAG TPA: PhnA protein [Bacteroidetes bacterium]|nr:PhnA protein [Bacteroidota bacterium]
MSLEKELLERSNSACELCGAAENLKVYTVPPKTSENLDDSALLCANCLGQIEDPEKVNAKHWRCLNESMWSEVPAVKVLAYRMLNRLRGEGWPLDLLDMLYLDDETLEWAKTGEADEEEEVFVHKDSNGVVLQAGDSVVLIKDLDVRGTSFTAKRGAAVRNIRLVHDNPEHIEGKVNGQQIVIITKYVKKTG